MATRRQRKNAAARACGYGIFAVYKPSTGKVRYHVSTPNGFGTYHVASTRSRAQAWAMKHCGQHGLGGRRTKKRRAR